MTHGDKATRCIGVNCHAKDGGTSGYSKSEDYYDEERDISINISKSTWKYLLQDLTIEMETLVNLFGITRTRSREKAGAVFFLDVITGISTVKRGKRW